MKKLICLLAVLLLALPLGAHAEASDPEKDEGAAIVAQALEELKELWRLIYRRYAVAGIPYTLDIRGARLIRIKEELAEPEAKYFDGLQYVVEFLFYDDYYSMDQPGSGHMSGYTDFSGMNNSVAVGYSGSMVPMRINPISLYRGHTYSYDFSVFIDTVIDYGGQFNEVFTFTFSEDELRP